MAGIELTLDEARKRSANFLYVFTNFKVNGKPYLSYIDSKHRAVILGKRGNQQKILLNSAKCYLGDYNRYSEYVDAVRKGFQETYGMNPEDALVKLGKGETVAGKNWNEGVYGIGAINVATFYGTDISVDPSNGHISKDGKDYTDESKTVYTEIKKQAVAYQLFATINGVTYMSQYNKTYKKYYAKTYSNDSGTYNANNGKATSAEDAGSVWENVTLSWDTFKDWITALINAIFGLNIQTSSDAQDVDTIKPSNTLPEQQADGFSQEAGMETAIGIALAAVAAGTLIAGGFFKKKSGKKK